MADKKFNNKITLGKITTPIGVAVYPHLVTPDDKWKSEGEYRTKIKYDSSTADGIRETLTKFLDKAFDEFKTALENDGKKAKLKTLAKADLPLKPETDEEGEETGMFLLSAKRTASGVSKKTQEQWYSSIAIADSTGKVVGIVTADPSKKRKFKTPIWSGTELRIQATVSGWYSPKDNEVGVSLSIDGVQIKKLVSGGTNVEFDAVEGDGWTAEDSAEPGDNTDTDAADTSEDGDDTPDF